jgi:hypothetical protein
MTNKEQVKRFIERQNLIKLLEFSLPEPQIFDRHTRKLVRNFQINLEANNFLKEKYGH